MLSAIAQLVVRELRVRWGGAALAVLLLAMLSAVAVVVELLGRAREHAIATRLDAMGPALSIVPPGVTSGALHRLELGDAGLPADIIERVTTVTGNRIRTVEARRIGWADVEGARAPTIAVTSWPAGVPDDGVLLGAELARRVRSGAIFLEGVELPVRGIRAPTGDVEDVAAILPLRGLARDRRDGANELRLFLQPGTSAEGVQRLLQASGLPIAVVRHDRGDVADHLLQDALVEHRAGAYWIMALVAGACLLVASYLDAAERSVEIATLVAIGASRRMIIGAIAGRSAALASAGSLLGIAVGVGLVAMYEPGMLQQATLLSWSVASGTLVGAVSVALVAAAPTALAAVARDPVPSLQEP